MINELLKIISSNQSKLSKICQAGVEEYVDALNSDEIYPILHLLFSNSKTKSHDVLIDRWLENPNDKEFEKKFPEINAMEKALQLRFENMLNKIKDNRLNKSEEDYTSDVALYNKYHEEDFEKTRQYFIDNADRYLEVILPKFKNMLQSTIEHAVKDENYERNMYNMYKIQDIADTEFLEKLYKEALRDKKEFVLIRILQNPNTPSWILDEQINSKNHRIRSSIAENPNISEEQAYHLSRDLNEIVRSRLVANDVINNNIHEFKRVIDSLIKGIDGDGNIPFDVFNWLLHVNLSDDNLFDLACHAVSDSQILKIIHHKNMNNNLLKQIARLADNAHVRDFVKEYIGEYNK